ncbi:unnamed protein product, partial [Staurois parvus]
SLTQVYLLLPFSLAQVYRLSPPVLHRCTGSSPSGLHRCTGSPPLVLQRLYRLLPFSLTQVYRILPFSLAQVVYRLLPFSLAQVFVYRLLSPSVLHRCTGSSPSVLHRCVPAPPLQFCTGTGSFSWTEVASTDFTAHWEPLTMCIRSCSKSDRALLSFLAGGHPASSGLFSPACLSLTPPLSFIRA